MGDRSAQGRVDRVQRGCIYKLYSKECILVKTILYGNDMENL